jgi:copper(I)-binding protein
VTIPAKGEVAFKPGGAHLMVFGLKKPAEAGTTMPMTLTFERAGKVTVPVFVTANVDAELARHGPFREGLRPPALSRLPNPRFADRVDA